VSSVSSAAPEIATCLDDVLLCFVIIGFDRGSIEETRRARAGEKLDGVKGKSKG